ncbi:MAG: biotin--[acetyl-CoA-carboxylase] ligase [Bacteroidales bacterium]|nr:biotin--[acetyl-CoA-carboxylase] ligase [Bacteroidales bacterium]
MGKDIYRYKVIDSTNNEASRLISKGLVRSESFVFADFQEDGRGQQKNQWTGEAGKNIFMSWAVFPAFLSVNKQFQLSKMATLSIIEFLSRCEINATVKWPNDIMAGACKIGGVLIENSIMEQKLSHSIIGIGINVNQTGFPDFPLPATSMKLVTGRKNDFDIEELIDQLRKLLIGGYEMLGARKSDLLDKRYIDHLYRRGETSVFMEGKSRFRGIIRGVDEEGQLLVETGAGMRNFGFHEIKMVHQD